MHGMMTHALGRFVAAMHGAQMWQALAAELGLSPDLSGPLDEADAARTQRLVDALARETDIPAEQLYEDFGVYLVAHPDNGALRRLLRFGGADFGAFLRSLEQLDARARLALPGLDAPRIVLSAQGEACYLLAIEWPFAPAVHVAAGMLRAMADDYGALALIEHVAGTGLRVHVLDSGHAEGRGFCLAART